MAKWTQADELIITLGTVPTLQSTLMVDLGYTNVESFMRIVKEAGLMGYDIARARFQKQTVLAHTSDSLRREHRKEPSGKITDRRGLSERRAMSARLQYVRAK